MKSQDHQSQQEQVDENNFLFNQLNRYLQIESDSTDNQKYCSMNILVLRQSLRHEISQLLTLVNMLMDTLLFRNAEIKRQKEGQVQKQEKVKANQEPNGQTKAIPPLIIKQIKSEKRSKQVLQMSVANKLKVMVAKSMQKQSTKLKYLFPSFISLISDELQSFQFEKNIENTRKQLEQIQKNFVLINEACIKLHRHHVPSYMLNPNANVSGLNFVNLYQQSLLFFQGIPLPFNANLLFIPLIFLIEKNKQTNKKSHVRISQFYESQLERENENWQNYTLQLIVRNSETKKIIHYFCPQFQKKASEIEIFTSLRKIRSFIYFKLLFNYLHHIFGKDEIKRALRIMISDDMVLEINTIKQIEVDLSDKIIRPQIFQDFLKYFDSQRINQRKEKSREEVIRNFQLYFRTILIKIRQGISIPEQYLKMKTKYIYFQNKRLQV